MSRWRDFRRDMAAELFFFAYAMAWVVALLLTFMLTN